MLLPCAIERSKTKYVERMMRRAKLILGLLISALWLAGSLQSLCDQVTLPAAGDPGASLCAAGHQPDSSTSANFLDQAIGRAVRRSTTQAGLDRVLTLVVIAQAGVHFLDSPFRSLDSFRDTLQWVQSWQFRLRAALPPRAPSCIS